MLLSRRQLDVMDPAADGGLRNAEAISDLLDRQAPLTAKSTCFLLFDKLHVIDATWRR
jgi:hypothetical protein